MNPQKHYRCGGFSLIEIIIALFLIMILAAYAIPNAATAIANINLRGVASDFSGLVQRARITSIQKNAKYTILFGLPTTHGAYIDLNGDNAYTSGEPMIQFGGKANQAAAPGGVNGGPRNLDAGGGPLGWTATTGNISFNARGLPCNTSANPCGTNVNYIFYFKDTRPFGGNGWAATSITAAARSKVWIWDGSRWIN